MITNGHFSLASYMQSKTQGVGLRVGKGLGRGSTLIAHGNIRAIPFMAAKVASFRGHFFHLLAFALGVWVVWDVKGKF
jgi:hypothetical protein